MPPILDYARQHVDTTVAAIERLVRLESPSTDKAAVDRCGRELAHMLRDAGAAVEIVPQSERGDHIRARFSGEGRPVMLLGHFDTVWPVGTLATMPLRRAGDKLHGPGAFDMKAGIAIGLGAMAALGASAAPHPAVTMVWTTDEEIGSGTSRALIEDEARSSRAVLVLEPALPGGALKTARKGCGEFELTVHGIAAHAGLDPGRGASAIHELATQIGAIEALQDLSRGISVNVGRISGGSRANVVAERASATIDVRAPTGRDAESIEAALRRLQPGRAGTRLILQGGFDRPPMERTPATAGLFAAAAAISASFGHELHEGTAGGGSDGNFTAALGVPTLDGLGAVGDGAHAVHEHIDVDALPLRVALVAGIIARL
jgi:glutamate carboxypeptidase